MLLAGLLAAAPSATGVLFDLPEVIDGAREALAASGQADRLSSSAGLLRAGARRRDLCLLKSSFTTGTTNGRWRSCATSTARQARARPAVAVIEGLLPSQPAPSQVHLANLMMLVAHGGRERTLRTTQTCSSRRVSRSNARSRTLPAVSVDRARSNTTGERPAHPRQSSALGASVGTYVSRTVVFPTPPGVHRGPQRSRVVESGEDGRRSESRAPQLSFRNWAHNCPLVGLRQSHRVDERDGPAATPPKHYLIAVGAVADVRFKAPDPAGHARNNISS